jgi:methylenetetrahydrofolate dehydrogenase (NADP+)/methenyltetrahydrofolate cyclohydrolase
MASLIDGRSMAAALRAALRDPVAELARQGVRPCLAVILVGDDPASRVYVRTKTLASEESGVRSQVHAYPAGTREARLLERIAALNADPAVHGILVQLPLPGQIRADRVSAAVAPEKDVDGFHPRNLGALLAGSPGFVPCTPAGVMRMLEHARVALAGRHAVIIGRSTIVGKPMALLLLRENATVTICHSKTRRLAEIARQADVLVAAVGKPRMVTADMVKPGACVIDVGVNRLADGSLAGDVDFAAVREVAGAITPVPGGVGPMTVAMLIANTVQAATRSLAGAPSSA